MSWNFGCSPIGQVVVPIVHELQLEETPLHLRLDPIPPLPLTTPKPLLPTPPSPRPTSI